jgi:hypothetical protein
MQAVPFTLHLVGCLVATFADEEALDLLGLSAGCMPADLSEYC